jgi:PAS domain S-box-containing protein
LQTLADHCAGTLARIRARESLETSEARYRLLVENQGEGLGVVDCDERFLLSNPAADKIFGVARGGLLGRSLMEFLSPEQREVVRQQSDHRARGKPGNYELTITRSDGRSRVLLVTVTPQADEHGKYTQAFEIFRDITQRKRAELMVARSELRLRLIWEHALTPMRLTDETGKIVMVNRAFCQFTRKGREQLEGHPLWVAYDPANKDTVLRDYMERFQRGNDIQQRTVEVKFWDGRRASVEMAETFFNLPGQPPLLLSVAHDITERRELEAQIRQMQRLESVGQLAAGVAHDFNNMLAVIQGQAYILNMDLGPDCPAAESVRQIQQAAERAANLTRQLLLFSRKQTLQANVLNLGETVQNMAKMLRRLLGEHIEIEFVPPAESASVLADVGMMEQVLLNLCVNARDSMPHGGRLRVETRVVEVTADDARHMPEARAGRHVCLSVADTGSGIPPETLARIFEPFFTTKAVGKGTGLGLATVYGIVRQHQGWIAVDTELGQGTTFQVFLPFNDGQVLAAGPEATAPRLLAGSGKTLLVVEDEPGLRGVTCTILQRQGYRVLTAESGPQALELAKTAGPLDLMITDMVMPHMSGRELADALRQLQPNLRVLFTSGYSAEASDTTFLRRAGGRFLPKPYAAEVLCRTVAECLEEKPA